MSKALLAVAVFLFVGAMSEFVQQDPVIYHAPGQPVTINEVLATMTTSYMLKRAPGDRQFMYIVFSALPIGLACLWRAFDRRQTHRPKAVRAFGAVLFVFGSMFAGMIPAFSAISPSLPGRPSPVAPVFALAAVFLAASWPLCFGLRLVGGRPQSGAGPAESVPPSGNAPPGRRHLTEE
jgi:hypothetical protein